MSGLTGFQADVARLFFSLPAAEGFLLAGGSALLATGLSTRPTHDLDFFGQPGGSTVPDACAQLEAACVGLRWRTERLQYSDTFARLLVVAPQGEVLVDLAIDAGPGRPPVMSIVGPTFDLEELAGRKLLALFDRAEARDFVDVYVLAQRFGTDTLLAQAALVDRGFDRRVLAEMIRRLDRYIDTELPATDQPAELRDFFARWAADLEQDPDPR